MSSSSFSEDHFNNLLVEFSVCPFSGVSDSQFVCNTTEDRQTNGNVEIFLHRCQMGAFQLRTSRCSFAGHLKFTQFIKKIIIWHLSLWKKFASYASISKSIWIALYGNYVTLNISRMAKYVQIN